MANPIKVTVWNEFWHEQTQEKIKKVYPDGIHMVIAGYLEQQGLDTRTATLYDPEQGLSDEVIADTDVLVWWSHMKNNEVRDDIVDKLHQRVLEGMGLIVLHSAGGSKLFRRLMGTSCKHKWREANERERVWVMKPGHPIVDGIEEYFELEEEEMYGEYWDIPEPDEVVLMSWFEGGNIGRSGVTFSRGKGKVFYFRPGHEEHPTYYNANVLRIIGNSVRWAAPLQAAPSITAGNVKSIEPVKGYLRDGRGNKVEE